MYDRSIAAIDEPGLVIATRIYRFKDSVSLCFR